MLIAADLVMQELEEFTLEKLQFTFNFYYKYVDDTLLCPKKQNIDIILKNFNEYESKLKFTIELGDKLNFLTLIKEDKN